jgi:hypothetical protein
MAPIESLAEYYADPFVRLRIQEYCGASPGSSASCVFLAGMDGREGPHATWDSAPLYAEEGLGRLLDDGAEISRSMWDTSHLLIHIDVDYLNVDLPGEPYQHQIEVFCKLEPTYKAAQHVLRRFDLPLFVLLTGRGYHFTGLIPLDSPVAEAVAALAPEPPAWVGEVAARRPRCVTADLTPEHARAYVGAGLLSEFLAQQILRRARRRSSLPVVLNGTIVGTGRAGRECVSLDLSYAGDPLTMRHIRVAFSAYQKHRFRPDIVGRRIALEQPPFIAVPRHNEPLTYLVTKGRRPRNAARAARAQSASLPVVAEGVTRVIAAYKKSPLAEFHRSFYCTPVRRGREMQEVAESLQLDALPPCVVDLIRAPNDRLLQPAAIQHVTRMLMAEGVKPRDIAALIHSRYAEDFGWGSRWLSQNPETRAEFDVRVFAGLVATGIDQAVDFNCRSAQEKELCPGHPCTRDLRMDRTRLLERHAP